jgi:hypothetical protein
MNVEIGTEVCAIPRKGIHKWYFPCSAVSFFVMKLEIGLVLLSYLASANCLPNGETFARKAESYLGNFCLVLSIIKI